MYLLVKNNGENNNEIALKSCAIINGATTSVIDPV